MFTANPAPKHQHPACRRARRRGRPRGTARTPPPARRRSRRGPQGEGDDETEEDGGGEDHRSTSGSADARRAPGRSPPPSRPTKADRQRPERPPADQRAPRARPRPSPARDRDRTDGWVKPAREGAVFARARDGRRRAAAPDPESEGGGGGEAGGVRCMVGSFVAVNPIPRDGSYRPRSWARELRPAATGR